MEVESVEVIWYQIVNLNIIVLTDRLDRLPQPPLHLHVGGDLLGDAQTQVDLVVAVRHQTEPVPPVPGARARGGGGRGVPDLELGRVRGAERHLHPDLEGGSLADQSEVSSWSRDLVSPGHLVDVVADDPGEVGVVGPLQPRHHRGQTQVAGVPQLLHQPGLGVLPHVGHTADRSKLCNNSGLNRILTRILRTIG